MNAFPYIFIQTGNSANADFVIEKLNRSGGILAAIITTDGLKPSFASDATVPNFHCKKEAIERTLHTLIPEIGFRFSHANHLVVFRNETERSTVAFKGEFKPFNTEPETVHFLEIEPETQASDRKSALIRKFRRIAKSPYPALWIIPMKAIRHIPTEGFTAGFFPLSWIYRLSRNGIPIQWIRVDSSGHIPERSNAYSRLRLILYAFNLFLRYTFSALFSFLIDNLVFWLMILGSASISVSLVIGRIASMLVNYSLLRTVVFSETGTSKASFLRYLGLVFFSGAVVWLSIRLILSFLPLNPLPVKLAVEGLMFFFNYYISKKFIFCRTDGD